MKLYDNILNDFLLSIHKSNSIKLKYDSSVKWKKNKDYALLLKKDTKVELGASPYKSVNMSCATSDKAYFDGDEIYLIGKDIPDIEEKSNYARVVFLQVADLPNREEELYKEIKNMEFVKYNMFLDGIMIRTSALDKSEQIRISKKSIEKGFNFSMLGSEFINNYKKNPFVKNVKIFFITEEDFDISNIIESSRKNDEITRALNTMLNGMNFDCQSCNLKPICDEVEGMKELHFNKKK